MTAGRWLALVLCLILVCANSCRRPGVGSGRSGERVIQPVDVNFAGLRFGLTRAQVVALIPSIRCGEESPDSEVCVWTPARGDRKPRFPGVEHIRCDFRRGALHGIRIEYADMVDLEFSSFDRNIRDLYSDKPSDKGIDTVFAEWRFDSLAVSLTPNKRQHWTRQLTIFAPVLEIARR